MVRRFAQFRIRRRVTRKPDQFMNGSALPRSPLATPARAEIQHCPGQLRAPVPGGRPPPQCHCRQIGVKAARSRQCSDHWRHRKAAPRHPVIVSARSPKSFRRPRPRPQNQRPPGPAFPEIARRRRQCGRGRQACRWQRLTVRAGQRRAQPVSMGEFRTSTRATGSPDCASAARQAAICAAGRQKGAGRRIGGIGIFDQPPFG